MKRGQIIENLEITDIVVEGKALGRVDDFVVFVENSVPGDVVDVRITKKKSSYAEGFVVDFKKLSEIRQNAICKHFGTCGGCRWQNISYDKQLKFKEKIVKDNFERIAKVVPNEFLPIMGSEKIFFYRNKLEYTFSNRRWLEKNELENIEKIDTRGLGFHLPRMFDRIVDIDECFLQSDFSNQIRNGVRQFAKENDLEFADTRLHNGFLKNLIVRNTVFTNQIMVIFVFGYEDNQKIKMLLDFVKNKFGQINSLIYFINQKVNDSIFDLDFKVYSGNAYITEELNGLLFRIGPKSFFQTNSQQAQNLYNIAIDFAQLTGNEIVYDLYTGTGTIAQLVSRKAQKVVGIEAIDGAIEDARSNAKLNKIENVDFFVGEVEKLLNEDFFAKNGKPDVIIVDPPRSGLHPKVVEAIEKSKAQKIVYVSCNPSTQARDVALLKNSYSLQKMQPVDMFPHTFHIENVALLKLK